MVEIKLHEVIDSASNKWFYEWMGMNEPFSLESLQRVMENNPNKGIKLSIHCDGGNVEEGLAIYDALRTSGRKIVCNVEGKCHSMAIVLLLAAPKENRTANPNAQFLIHEVSGGVEGNVTAMQHYVEEAQDMQNRILDIYADRTGYDRAELERIMKEEKTRDADFMLAKGFIGAINKYNTNLKNMNIIEGLKNLLAKAEEENEPQNASPSAELEAKITELNGVIESQADAMNAATEKMAAMEQKAQEQEKNLADRDARINELEGQLSDLNKERDGLVNTLTERDNEINELRSQLKSNYKPDERNAAPSATEKPEAKTSREAEKDAVREAMRSFRKK